MFRSDVQQCSTVQDMPTYGKVQCFEMLQGMDEIMLTVEEVNQDARKLYGSLGFQEYSRRIHAVLGPQIILRWAPSAESQPKEV